MAVSQKFSELFQKFLASALPKNMSEEMEKESRSWMVQCSNCKYERSVWEMGGIRWKAAGNPRVYRRCINCDTKSWHMVYKRTG
jgi:hypothetical protein